MTPYGADYLISLMMKLFKEQWTKFIPSDPSTVNLMKKPLHQTHKVPYIIKKQGYLHHS